MRELHPAFMDDLHAGRLRALLERVWLDRTLDLEIREDYLRLREALSTLPETRHCEVLVAGSSLAGYGLFDPTIRSVAQALNLPHTLL
jgi:hypothetical protein